MCKVEPIVMEAKAVNIKDKLEDDFVTTERKLADLRVATNTKTGIDLGKARRIGLEVLFMNKNYFI